MTIIEEILAFQPVAEVNESFKLQKKTFTTFKCSFCTNINLYCELALSSSIKPFSGFCIFPLYKKIVC